MPLRNFLLFIVTALISWSCLDGPVEGKRIRRLAIFVNLQDIDADSANIIIDDRYLALSLQRLFQGSDTNYYIADTLWGPWDQTGQHAHIRAYNNNRLVAEWRGWLRLGDENYQENPPIYLHRVDDFDFLEIGDARLYYSIIDSIPRDSAAIKVSWDVYDNLRGDFKLYVVGLRDTLSLSLVADSKIYEVRTTSVIFENIDLNNKMDIFFRVYNNDFRPIITGRRELY